MRLILFFVSSVGCSVILVAGNWAILQIVKYQNWYRILDLFWHHNIFASPRSKMTTVPLFSRQNDVGLCALNVFLWENLVHVVVHVLENLKLSIIDQARAQGHILFCLFEDHDEVEVHKKAKRERSQYPAILTELDWSMKDLLYGIPRFFVLPCGTCQAFGLLCIAILCSGSSNL